MYTENRVAMHDGGGGGVVWWRYDNEKEEDDDGDENDHVIMVWLLTNINDSPRTRCGASWPK